MHLQRRETVSDDTVSTEKETDTPRWQPLSAVDRRVMGVLVEKAKTTPDNYPLSLNAVCTACNQKSNRRPVMNLDPADVEESLERLRKLGAVGFVSGYGRVEKYRHYGYEWFGVDKVELAIVAELLLRGPQTMGELRAHVARMEPVRNLEELQPIVASLKSKGLVIPLTPEGRGHVVTHALYPPAEMERVRAQYATGGTSAPPAETPEPLRPTVAPSPAARPIAPPDAEGAPAATTLHSSARTMENELAALHGEVSRLRTEVERLSSLVEQVRNELARLRADLGG